MSTKQANISENPINNIVQVPTNNIVQVPTIDNIKNAINKMKVANGDVRHLRLFDQKIWMNDRVAK